MRLLKTEIPDIVCLQETKCPDDAFPHAEINNAGYTAHVTGMKSYNGVAILSRAPQTDPRIHARVGRNDCRHISSTIDGIDIHCVYIPAGGDIPDPDLNDKFVHKLDFVNDITRFFKNDYSTKSRVLVAGDFNIAPHEHDVWSHRQLLDVVSHTPIEVKKLSTFQASLNFIDTARAFVPLDQKSYTWWSYRNRDWRASNRGRRLDHIWTTPGFQKKLKRYSVLDDYRDGDKPSDHVPVVLESDGGSSSP
jgi:exodeoxyribonuclease-3